MASTNILVIDDDKFVLSLIKKALDNSPYTGLYAHNGKEGLEVAKNRHPNLIVLDKIMPDLDGNEVLKKLKENEKTKDIPVIMLTGRDSSADINQSFALGATDYIVKPFDQENLLIRIKKILK